MIEETGIAIGENSGFRYKVNQYACLSMCIWMTYPYLRSKLSSYVFIAALIIWLLSTEFKWLTKLTKDIYFIALFFVTFIPYFITGNIGYGLNGPKMIYIVMPTFFAGMFINQYHMYYKKDFDTLRKIAIVSFITFTVGSLQTYYGLLKYPNAARALAGSIWAIDQQLGAQYLRLGIGGFGFIYAGCFLLVLALYPILVKSAKISGKYKLLCVVAFIVIALMIQKASYATALIISILGVIMIFLIKNRKVFIFIMIFAAVLLLFMPQIAIADLLTHIASYFSGNQIIYTKIAGLANGIVSGSLEGETSRLNLYMASLKTFLSHPLFGIYGPFGGGEDPRNLSIVGGHSGWLDLLGYYGLFAGIPLYTAITINLRKHLKFFKGTKYYEYMLIMSFLFILLGIVNPTLTIIDIGFMFFLIVPSIPFLQKDFMQEKINQTTPDQDTEVTS